MKLLNLGLYLAVCAVLSSCNFVKLKNKEESLAPNQVESLSTNFASVKEIVFSSRCNSCHLQYETYQGVFRELNAIEDAVRNDRMPKSGGPLTENQKSILFAWIKMGAPEYSEGGAKPSEPVKLEPTWKSLSENVFFPKCTACHSPGGQAKFLDLTSREIIYKNKDRVFGSGLKFIDLNNSENSYLIQILLDEEEPMPPASSKIPRLDATEINVVKEWISLGLP